MKPQHTHLYKTHVLMYNNILFFFLQAGLAGVYSDVSNQRAWIDTQFAANGGTPNFCAP